MLDLGHLAADAGHPLHRLVVAALVDVALRREELQGDRQGEFVAAPPFAEVNDPLPARAQQPLQPQVFCPAELLALGEVLVSLIELALVTLGWGSAVCECTRPLQQSCRHRCSVPACICAASVATLPRLKEMKWAPWNKKGPMNCYYLMLHGVHSSRETIVRKVQCFLAAI